MLKKKLSVCFAVLILFAVINASATVQLKVYFKDEGIHESNIVKPRIYIKNVGTEAVSNFYYCYFIAVENGKIPTKQDFWMPNCTTTIEQIDAIHYKIKYSYSGFTLAPGAVEPSVDGNCLGIYYTDWSQFNKSNDFSYTPTATFQETNYIPV